MLDSIIAWATTQGVNLVNLVLKAVIIAVVGILAIRMIMKIITKALKKSKLEKAAHSLILTLSSTVMYVLLGLILASSLGIDVTGIVALASVVTLAVSLSVQNMLSNIVGGFTLLYTHPFSSGDYVEIAGQSGTVSEIGMTYTKLTTPDNKVIYIPNNAVVSAEITNYTVTGTRRLDISVSASYGDPVEKVLQVLLSCADNPCILTEPAAPKAMLTSYGDSVINYQLRMWVKGEDYWTVNFEIQEKLQRVFKENGIHMSYPHLNVHIDQ